MLLLGVANAVAQTAALSFSPYAGSDHSLMAYGSGQAEHYNCAVLIASDLLTGTSVTSLSLPVVRDVAHLTDCKLWLTRDIKIKSGRVSPDLLCLDAELVRGVDTETCDWLKASLPEPLLLSGEPLYAGVTFTVSEVSEGAADAKPLLVAFPEGGGADGNMWYHTSRSNRSFTNLGESQGAQLPLRLGLTGGDIAEVSLCFDAVADSYSPVGQPTELQLVLRNHGVAAVQSLGFHCALSDGTVCHQLLAFDKPLAGGNYGLARALSFTLPALEQHGTYPYTLIIDEVNGLPYADLHAAEGRLYVYRFTPTHRPLVEEYTGSWCVWCVRGAAGMKAMNERHPDDFIGVAYHNGDPMEILMADNYPGQGNSFPYAHIDRSLPVDPYYGTVNHSVLGIEDDWLACREQLAWADLDVTAEFSDESRTSVVATAAARFIRDFDAPRFQLSYLLIEDDMHGTGSRWSQCNAFANQQEYADDPYLSPYIAYTQVIPYFHFNDVVVGVATLDPQGIEQSLPQQIAEGEVYSHSYTFTLADLVNTAGEPVVQDTDHLHVVSVLIDTTTGSIVNAARADLPASDAAIRNIAAPVSASLRYDLLGRPCTTSSLGVFIRK